MNTNKTKVIWEECMYKIMLLHKALFLKENKSVNIHNLGHIELSYFPQSIVWGESKEIYQINLVFMLIFMRYLTDSDVALTSAHSSLW